MPKVNKSFCQVQKASNIRFPGTFLLGNQNPYLYLAWYMDPVLLGVSLCLSNSV